MMKTKFQFLMLTSLFSSAAFSQTALITKINGSGFVPLDYIRNERCDVFADKVVISKILGAGENGVRTLETRKFKIEGNMQKLLQGAANAKIQEKENFLCDGPSTTISAGETLLFSTGGCGTSQKEREGIEAMHLRAIIDTYCPTTHQFSK